MKKIKISIIGIAVVLFALTACTNRVIPVGPGGYPWVPDHNTPSTETTVPDGGVQIGDGEAVISNNLDEVLASSSSTAPVAVSLGKGAYTVSAETFATKISSLTGAGEETIVEVDTTDVTGQEIIEIKDGSKLTNVTIKIGSESETQSFAALNTQSARAATSTGTVLLNVTGDDVVFDGVHIEIVGPEVAYNVIQVLGNNFTFKNGSITGVPYDVNGNPLTGYFSADTDYSSVNMGIAIGSGVSDVTISNSTFEGNYTPVYSSSPDFTMTSLTFDSGIELEFVSADSEITGCKKLTDKTGYIAKINIMTSTNGAATTDYDLANTVRDKLAKANPDIDDVRINNYTETELQTYYGGFASQRFLGALYVSMIGGRNAITVNSAEYTEETENGVVTVSLNFDGYNYLGTNNLFSGENVTIKFIGGKKTDTGFTATSIVVNGSGIVSDNAKQYREIPVTFTDVEAGVGTESTEGRGIPFVFLGEKPCICDFASGVSTNPNYVQYEKTKHEFQIEFPIEGLVAEF